MTSIAFVVLVASSARAENPAADELKKLQGNWQVTEVEARGKKAGRDDPEIKSMRFVIKGDELSVGSADGGATRQKTFKVDPTKSPREIDLTSLDGQEKDTTAACIYKLDGDRLTICMPYFTKDPSTRPKEFKAGADDGFMVITLERVNSK
jgi:uncharacterized protein (TIGR03067 family)